MLVIVEMVGFVGKGAQRWIDLGFIRLQPSEFMKPAIVLVLARFYELLPPGAMRTWRAIWPAALLLGVPFLLVLIQPDMGTALMIVFIGITVMFVAGRADVAVHRRRRRHRRRDAARLCLHARISAQAGADLPRSGSRSARLRLSHQPVEDRHRLRAGSSAKAISRAARSISIICRKAIPISSSRRWSRNGD